ncbi:hypothetical protein BC332_33507 [Capsicum chinense]|nr:hypothetical protein BC332_33507 [Capsicum chinense]
MRFSHHLYMWRHFIDLGFDWAATSLDDFGLPSVSCPNLEKLFINGAHSITALGSHQLPTAIYQCPEMKTFLQQGFVYCPSLEKLFINGANSITALCSHQLPTAYFSKLEILEVRSCEKLRNLMTPSVARGLLNLRTLSIKNCQMEEVITEEEPQGEEIMTNEPLFPRLEELIKLGHFILTKRALKFPFLRAVKIQDCPEMKTFIQQGSVSTPSLESVNNDDEVKVDDLNEWIHQRFNSKDRPRRNLALDLAQKLTQHSRN